jgi:hypothetical protein
MLGFSVRWDAQYEAGRRYVWHTLIGVGDTEPDAVKVPEALGEPE